MICRTCGTEIADKALICYRCGTATTEAKFKAPPAAGRRGTRLAIFAAIVVALLVLLAFFLLHSRGLTTDAGPDRLYPGHGGPPKLQAETEAPGSQRWVGRHVPPGLRGRSGRQVTW